MATLPTGIVTFLFTDIEGSTRLLHQATDSFRDILEKHSEIAREMISRNGGSVVSTEGDSFFAVFPSPGGAVRAAADFQRGLATHQWPAGVEVKVRMGVHTGEGTAGGDNYVGLDVNRAARIAAAGHGGQVLISNATAVLVENRLPDGTSLRLLGEHRLKDLARSEIIHQLVIQGLTNEFPPPKTIGAASNNLPLQLTSFVSRPETAAVSALLEESRMVTLTGPGGTGKTRLALQVAALFTKRLEGGVWFVPLAAITDPELVTTAVAATLGMQPSRDDPDRRLTEYLSGKEMLLLLDNFEQVLGAAPKVAAWLQTAPKLKVLVTSRGPLRISGEQEFSVPPLAVPDRSELLTPESLQRFEAVALFVDRAKATRPDFALDSTNVTHVAEIVSRLDGLPLAIELAAARVRLLSVEAIRERLTSRLGLLTGGARDLPERQRTLRNAIEWSYDLLDAQHRQLFERLGVFAGGFALEQAEEVCGSNLDLDILDGLATLVDQSLLKPHEAPGHARFLMLETIREYADERLNARPEAPDVRRRHADAFLRLAETAAPEYLRKQSRRWLDRSDADHDNFRAAISWAIDVGQAEIAQCLTGALWRFWQMRGYLKEGRERVEAALVLHGGSVYSRLRAHEAAGGLAYWQAETGASLKHYEQALTLAREIGDPALTAQAIYNLASGTSLQEVARGLELLAEGLTLADQLGDRELLGRLHWGKGGAYYLANTKDLGAALTEYQTAAEFLAGTAASFDIGWTERMLATVLLRLGRVDEAEGHIRTSLNTFVEAGDLSALPLHLADFVQLALARGEDERAILLAGAAGELQNVSGTRLLDIFPNEIGGLEEAIDRVGRERAEKVAAEGRALSVNQILDLVADH